MRDGAANRGREGDISMPPSTMLGFVGDESAGHVDASGAPHYERSRRVWNGMIDRRPPRLPCARIARCSSNPGSRLKPAQRHGARRWSQRRRPVDSGKIFDRPRGAWSISMLPRPGKRGGGALWRDFDAVAGASDWRPQGPDIEHRRGRHAGRWDRWLVRKYGLASDNLLAAEVARQR
jgi:hypothetical protein